MEGLPGLEALQGQGRAHKCEGPLQHIWLQQALHRFGLPGRMYGPEPWMSSVFSASKKRRVFLISGRSDMSSLRPAISIVCPLEQAVSACFQSAICSSSSDWVQIDKKKLRWISSGSICTIYTLRYIGAVKLCLQRMERMGRMERMAKFVKMTEYMFILKSDY